MIDRIVDEGMVGEGSVSEAIVGEGVVSEGGMLFCGAVEQRRHERGAWVSRQWAREYEREQCVLRAACARVDMRGQSCVHAGAKCARTVQTAC